jgi:hypothetical protein
MSRKQLALLEPSLVRQALLDAVKKLSPRVQWHNPVMFIVWIGSVLTTLLAIAMAGGELAGNALFTAAISLWLWFTVLFANFAEALAEGRSKAQANSLKGVKKTAFARKLREPKYGAQMDHVPADELRKGDVVLVEAGDIIPCDGEVIEGGASVDESAITGESAPVIRESGGDFASVTGGTRILSDWLVIQCSVNPGETFLDRMIAMVEDIPHRLLEVGRKQRGKDKQTPHAVNDTGDGRQQFDGDTERASQPARRQLRQEQGDTKAYGNRNQQGDERGHQRAVNRHQRTKDFVWRVPLFGPQEGETEFLDARPGGKNQRHDNAAQQQ